MTDAAPRIGGAGSPDVLVVFGTRPEAVKLAPVIHRLGGSPGLTSFVLATDQHRHMLESINRSLNIEPDGVVEVFRAGQHVNTLLSTSIAAIDAVIADRTPRLVLVQGDTTAALGAALAGFGRGCAVVHLEAGLRTHDLASPFPEEANRQLISRVASLHLATTQQARSNLVDEGIAPQRVSVIGNTVVDALVDTLTALGPDAETPHHVWLAGRTYVVITMHRRESWDGGIRATAVAVRQLAARFEDIAFIVAQHRNPVVREPLNETLAGVTNVLLTEPMDYPDFSLLMSRALLILSDSGGIQEEAPTLGVPVVVLRSVTERPEAVAVGACTVAGTRTENVVATATALIEERLAGTWVAPTHNPFGDGRAAHRAVSAMAAYLADEPLPADFVPGA